MTILTSREQYYLSMRQSATENMVKHIPFRKTTSVKGNKLYNQMTLIEARKKQSDSHRQQVSQVMKLGDILRENESFLRVMPERQFTRSTNTKSVRFSDMAIVHTLPEQMPEDVMNSWYNLSDYAHFARERRFCLRAFHTLGAEDFEQEGIFTIVGLEHMITRQQSVERKFQTKQHSRAVLQQQYLNVRQGVPYDEYSLQRVSEQYSGTPSCNKMTALEYQEIRVAEAIQRERQRRYRLEQQNYRQNYVSCVLDEALSVHNHYSMT